MEELIRLGSLFPKFLLEILTAIVCGGLIALERGVRRTTALRNTVLICLGAALYMMVADLIGAQSTKSVIPTLTGDPGENEYYLIRMAAQVAIAVALLGVGVIYRYRKETGGVGRAVTYWVTAAVGLIIGVGHPMLGLLVTAITLLVLTLLNIIEKNLITQPRSLLLKLTLREDSSEIRSEIQELLKKFSVHTERFRSESGPNGIKITINAAEEPTDLRSMIAELWTIRNIIEIEH